jgi:hypothetical protein
MTTTELARHMASLIRVKPGRRWMLQIWRACGLLAMVGLLGLSACAPSGPAPEQAASAWEPASYGAWEPPERAKALGLAARADQRFALTGPCPTDACTPGSWPRLPKVLAR